MQPFFTAIDTFLKEEGKAQSMSILITRLKGGGLGVTVQSNDPEMCHMRSFSVKGTPAHLDEAFAGALMSSRTATTISIGAETPQDDLPPAEAKEEMGEDERKRRLNAEWTEARNKYKAQNYEDCLIFLEKASDFATQEKEKEAISAMALSCKNHLKKP